MSAAAVLEQHAHDPFSDNYDWHCRCGKGDSIRSGAKSHAEHQIDALKAAGFAVVELPEALDDDGINRAWPHASYWLGQERITLHQVPARDLTATQARAIAASLLAAADASEAT